MSRHCRKTEKMKKLRHVKHQSFERQEYVKGRGMKEVSEILRTKLNMWNMGRDLGGNEEACRFCKDREETIEHLLECEEIEGSSNERGAIDGSTEELIVCKNFIKRIINNR